METRWPEDGWLNPTDPRMGGQVGILMMLSLNISGNQIANILYILYMYIIYGDQFSHAHHIYIAELPVPFS